MCGGAGTRLWPLSREDRPKQFIALFDQRSTFQETLLRVADPKLFGRPIVVTGAAYRSLVLDQLAEIQLEADIVLETARRDSGPAIVAGSILAHKRAPDAVVLALAADHVVKDASAFVAACTDSVDVAERGYIVTFGVRPDRAATEYGYILPGDAIDENVWTVKQFVEKPDAPTAARYLNEGYLWNSGNFMFRAEILIDEYRKADAASIAMVTQAIAGAARVERAILLDKTAFESAKSISIDYAVMERTKRAAVIPVAFGWSDVGSWHAVWELSEKDAFGNVVHGEAVLDRARNCYVSSDRAIVALEGVDDLVVVVTEDAVLVSRQRDSSGLKRLVAGVKDIAPEVTERHPRHRSLRSHSGDKGYAINHLQLAPGESLRHDGIRKLSTRWVVVRGIARVVAGDSEATVGANGSFESLAGTEIRLDNPGDELLELIEIVFGR